MKTLRSLKMGVGDTLIQICIVKEEMKKSEKEKMNRNNFLKTNTLSLRDVLNRYTTHSVF